jgi:PhnB protein
MERTIMQLNHYLNFQGEAEAAFNFYKSVFGGEFAMLKRYGEMPSDGKSQLSDAEKNYILHVSLPINEFTILMASDTTEQFCAANSPFIKGTNHYISINLEKHEQAEAQRLYEALSQNGQIEMPLEKTFWGALYAAFTDQFGVKWMVNCQLVDE